MAMTDEERFRFDLAGFLIRPAILDRHEIDEIVDQIDRIKHNPESLPAAHRAVPGGASSLLIDHPKVIDVIHEVIGPNIRIESSFCIWRTKGESPGGLHGGGPIQADPIFGYRVKDGRIHAGMVRVVFELTDIGKEDGATHFIIGSHKANFPMHPDHMSLEPGQRSEFLRSFECPAGSAIIFTESLCHAGPAWQRDTPRIAVFNAYSHLATNWHRLTIPTEVLAGLPREKQAYFREPWIADFRTAPFTQNTMDRFVNNDEPPVNTENSP